MKLQVRKLIAVSAVAFLIAGCGEKAVDSRAVSSTGSSLQSVKINQAFENLLYIGLYVAKDGGFFEKEGLDVQIETGGGDAQALSALTSGKAEFAQGDPAFVAIANEKGWDGRVVAAAVHRAALWGVTFDKSIKPFSDPLGFKGKTVATYPEPNTSYVIQKNLDEKAGLKLGRDTKILQVPYGTELATLSNHQADIAQTLEPNVSQVQTKGGNVVFSYADAWGPILFTGVMTSKQFIDEHPETVRKFVSGYEKALQYIHSNIDGTVEIAAKRFPTIPKDIIRMALTRSVKSGCVPEHTQIDPQSWKRVLEIRVQVGDLKRLPDKELVDNQFAESLSSKSR